MIQQILENGCCGLSGRIPHHWRMAMTAKTQQTVTCASFQLKWSRICCAESLEPFVLLASSSSIEGEINVIGVTVERMMSGLGDALWEHKPKRLSLCVSWVTRQGTETWNSHGRVCCCFLFWEREIVKYIYLDGYWYRYIGNFLIFWQFSHLNLPLLCRMKVYLILHLSLD